VMYPCVFALHALLVSVSLIAPLGGNSRDTEQ
jgi:hypothetical protein